MLFPAWIGLKGASHDRSPLVDPRPSGRGVHPAPTTYARAAASDFMWPCPARPDARPGRSWGGPGRAQPPCAGRCGGVHHVATRPVLSRVDADRAVDATLVLPVPALPGFLRPRARSCPSSGCPLAACNAASCLDRSAGREGAGVVRRSPSVQTTGPCDRAVPVDLGATARRGGLPAPG